MYSNCSITDIDECGQATLNLCDKQNGNCTDTTPGYTCFCQNGYTGDGFTCTGTLYFTFMSSFKHL